MEVTEHLKRSLNHHKKVTKNCKEHVILLVVTVTARGFASPNSNCSSSWVDSLATNRDFCAKTHLMLFFRVDDVDPNTTTTAILLVVVIDRWIDKFTVRPMGSYGLGKSFWNGVCVCVCVCVCVVFQSWSKSCMKFLAKSANCPHWIYATKSLGPPVFVFFRGCRLRCKQMQQTKPETAVSGVGFVAAVENEPYHSLQLTRWLLCFGPALILGVSKQKIRWCRSAVRVFLLRRKVALEPVPCGPFGIG